MFLYSLYGYEENIVLTHNKEFTREEFENMCKEAELGRLDFGMKFYCERNILNHLTEKYGFKKVNYTAGFFFDESFDEDEEDDK